MIDSKLFEKSNLDMLQLNLLNMLNNCPDFHNPHVYNSPRAVGDLVQDILGENMYNCFAKGLVQNFNGKFARRAMADIAFMDMNDNYFVIDVKTHNKDTHFNMPNLISVERLSKFYEDDNNFFVILFIEYHIENNKLIFTSVQFIPIEHFEWSCLTIGALGWGQIQIANANVININRSLTRKTWMLSLCDVLEVFYPKEIMKIQNRIDYFSKVRKFWESKS